MGARSAPKRPGRVGKGKRVLPVVLLRCAWCGRPHKTPVCSYCDDLPVLKHALLDDGLE